MKRFERKTIIVTGAASGIGLACARRFASEGARVAMWDVDRDKGVQETRSIVAGGDAAFFVHCDVGERNSVGQALQETLGETGRVDILVSNAGIIHKASFLDLEEEDFDRVMRVNLKGAFLTGQEIARQMVRQGQGGVIINMSSVNAVLALADQVPYSLSKGGIAQLTKVMALGLAEHGIRVNAIGPGSVMTDILRGVMTDAAAREKVLSRTPMGRIGEPEEIAGIAAFLASDDASYMTGQTLFADGGRLPLNYTVPVPEA